MTRPLILLTNDDGIESPGLAAAALAFDSLGDLLIVAPRTQQSGMGRSMPSAFGGRLVETPVTAGGRTWRGYAAEASPAQAVQHALLELTDRSPALAVSGINYGENVGTGVTISGTVGAALEAASFDIPSLAVSLEVDLAFHLTHDPSVDFSVAAHFARHFGEKLLGGCLLPDVAVLKIEIPAHARPDTPWRITRLETHRYYVPERPDRTHLGDEGKIGYRLADRSSFGENSDVTALLQGVVSVTPLSLDMTSRINLSDLRTALDGST